MIKYDTLISSMETTQTRSVIDIEALIKTKLPPINKTVMRVSELLRDDNVSTKRLAEVVGYDPNLAVRLLKLANSSLFFRQASVVSIQEAIDAVGLKALYDIVILGAMADGFASEIGNTISGRVIWEHSIVVGLLARELSNILGLRGTEEAFLCGLLHDIGKILLVKGETEKFEAQLDNTSEAALLASEEKVFGLTHAEIGAYVTYKWQLPDTVCNVIMYHHKPRLAQVSTVITYIVNAADIIANANGYGFRLVGIEELLQADSIKYLHLDAEYIELAWKNIQDSLREVLTMFR